MKNIFKTAISNLLQEDYNSEMDLIKSMGMEITDERTIGNYKIFLMNMVPFMEGYEIGMSSFDRSFFAPDAQIKQQSLSGFKEQMSVAKQMKEIVDEWRQKYQPLYAGTFNEERANRYHSLVTKMGFKASDVVNAGYIGYLFRIY